jgi:hypothetical protein
MFDENRQKAEKKIVFSKKQYLCPAYNLKTTANGSIECTDSQPRGAGEAKTA